MFTYIFNELFPIVGDWFGLVVGFSQITCNQFIDFVSDGRLTFDYVNVLTGELLSFSQSGLIDLPLIGDLLESSVKLFMQLLFSGVDLSMPLFVGLPFALVSKFLILIVIKWGLDFVR